MCIRDRILSESKAGFRLRLDNPESITVDSSVFEVVRAMACLLYTSDAADERSSVDLGGRRIIKNKQYKTASV